MRTPVCDCGERWVRMVHRDQEPGRVLGTPHYQLSIFKPYTDENFTGKPIEIRTKAHREAVCKKHGLTYDRYTNLRPKYKQKGSDALGEIGFEAWAKEMKEHGFLSGERTKQGTVGTGTPPEGEWLPPKIGEISTG